MSLEIRKLRSKPVALGFLVVGLVVMIVGAVRFYVYSQPLASVASLEVTTNPRTLDRYRFSFLREYSFEETELRLVRVTEETAEFTTWLAEIPTHSGAVSAQVRVPTGAGPYPIIILLRGYVDKSIYSTGVGTRNASAAFARAGYVTIAPDFLGYGESAPEALDVLETRFERPVTVLHALAAIGSVPKGDPSRIGIWAHSNGGQIALSVLQITGQPIPTTLWAPVSLGFPESITHFFPEFEDGGAYLQGQLNRFEERYSFDEYSISSHWSDLVAPVQLHQGGRDDAVPVEWSRDLYQTLQEHEVQVSYYEYPDADHNLSGSWGLAIQRDLEFFRRSL